VFVVTGVVSSPTTLLAMRSRPYRRLSRSFAESGHGGDTHADGMLDQAVDGVAQDARAPGA